MTTDIKSVKPTTVEGIKRLAKKIGKRDAIPHHQALEVAAKQAGYISWSHALNSLWKVLK